MNERLALLAQMDPYAGKYFSLEYLRRNILRQTDNEIDEINEQMQAEMDAGLIVSPCRCNRWRRRKWRCH